LPDDADSIADRLASLGFSVAQIERRPQITGVSIGKVLDIAKHPNADRLQVAHIDAGDEEPLTIATAATNVEAGQTIAVARIGAVLPQLTIAPRTMRGIASQGMMISAEELALTAEWFEDGIMQFDAQTPAGADVVALFGLNDPVLDVEITTNRADAMSVLGLARELAASYRCTLRLPEILEKAVTGSNADPGVAVDIATPGCTRFVVQRFDGLRSGAAPAWMRIRLALAGQRPIDSVVDVSNYVMLETGQPLHFYDAARLSGSTLVVRDARDDETLVTLDGVERTLSPGTMVIADDRHALGVAGVIGGRDSEVAPTTTAIVLEAATFDGARVRRAAKALGLRTEAATRHEKTLPQRLADFGASRAAWLLTRMGATASSAKAYGEAPEAPAPILLRIANVARLLGFDVPPARIASELQSLGCTVATESDDVGDALLVTPPWWRRDLLISADLVEEVARMEGYDRIEAAAPSVAPHEISSERFEREHRVAHALASLGYGEIVTYSLRAAEELERLRKTGIPFAGKAVEVLNPLSEDQRFLRTSLIAGFVAYCAQIDRPVRAFEIGDTFRANDDTVVEESADAIFGFAAGPIDEPAWRDTNFLRLKGDCEALLERLTGRTTLVERAEFAGLHPGKTAAVSVDGTRVATLGRIDPRLAAAFGTSLPTYFATVALDALPPYAIPRYRPPSKFPGTSLDLSPILAPEFDASQVEKAVEEAINSQIDDASVVVKATDEYIGDPIPNGKKSLTVNVKIYLRDSTITSEVSGAAMTRARDALASKFDATFRE
ncbi:MAG TPA: phenylalanine--tRNA ligase subunit beta, partial [Candidatus Acidoferrum sp.]|nr:phenylalanine--tRNA ligase subunit beta [Candidatus Acidoferrum sp.]